MPISLTDAFGCDRCHHIFTVDEKLSQLEQLSSVYAGKKAWYWSGSQWKPLQSGLKVRLPVWMIFTLIGWLVIGIFLAFHAFLPENVWLGVGIVGLAILLFIVFICFVLYRR